MIELGASTRQAAKIACTQVRADPPRGGHPGFCPCPASSADQKIVEERRAELLEVCAERQRPEPGRAGAFDAWAVPACSVRYGCANDRPQAGFLSARSYGVHGLQQAWQVGSAGLQPRTVRGGTMGNALAAAATAAGACCAGWDLVAGLQATAPAGSGGRAVPTGWQ